MKSVSSKETDGRWLLLSGGKGVSGRVAKASMELKGSWNRTGGEAGVAGVVGVVGAVQRSLAASVVGRLVAIDVAGTSAGTALGLGRIRRRPFSLGVATADSLRTSRSGNPSTKESRYGRNEVESLCGGSGVSIVVGGTEKPGSKFKLCDAL